MERAVVVERGKLLLAFTESTYSMDTIGRAGDLVGRLGTVAEREAMAAKLTPLVGENLHLPEKQVSVMIAG